MTIPSGSGTEVLMRATKHANNDNWEPIIIGEAHHIYTILSITACEMGDAAEIINIRVDVSAAGSNQIFIVNTQALGAKETFVFSDKLVLTGTDKLEIYNSAGDVDWSVSYIEQDFT